jgi:hypothetical protein
MKEYEFKVTEQEANLILAGLGKLPFEISVALIQKLQAQAAPPTETKGE